MKNCTSQKNNLTLLLLIIPFLMGTAVDLYVPSLPAITLFFNTKMSLVQLTISAYMLSGAVGALFFGALSDSFGRRNIILICALFFSLTSFFTLHISNIYWLIAMRFFQGLGTAGMGVAIRAAITDFYSGADVHKAANSVSLSWSLGPIIGPVIGGYLQHYFGWQADFYFFGFYGLIIFAFAFAKLPETNHNRHPLKIYILFSSLKEAFSHKIFLSYSIITALVYSILLVFNIVGPFLIQVTLHYSAVSFGHMALLLGFTYFLGNLLNRIALNRFAAMKIAKFGLIVAAIINLFALGGNILLAPNVYIILISTGLLFFACGFIIPNMMGKFLSLLPHIAGIASAASLIIVAGGAALTTTVATTLSTTTQLPITLTYIGIILIASILFMINQKLEGVTS